MRALARAMQASSGPGRVGWRGRGPGPYAVLVIAGIALMAVGVACGDFGAILANARLICLSCIGIQ